MKTPTAILIAFGALLSAAPSCAEKSPPKEEKASQSPMPKIKVERGTYHGWKKCVRLSNGDAELIFVPQLGRIMRYGYIGAPNILWNNDDLLGKVMDPEHSPKDWMNFGGDKLWPAPQSKWGWPPDPIMDAGLQEVGLIKDGIEVRGPVSPANQVKFSREIQLNAGGSGVTIKNTLTNVGKEIVSWSCWEVAQVDDPDRLRMPVNKAGSHPAGYFVFEGNAPDDGLLTLGADSLTLLRSKTKSAKIGGDSTAGWIEAERGHFRFRMQALVETGKPYPDSNSPLQIYTSANPAAYAELELLSPIVRLKPGQSTSFTVKWSITKLEN